MFICLRITSFVKRCAIICSVAGGPLFGGDDFALLDGQLGYPRFFMLMGVVCRG